MSHQGTTHNYRDAQAIADWISDCFRPTSQQSTHSPKQVRVGRQLKCLDADTAHRRISSCPKPVVLGHSDHQPGIGSLTDLLFVGGSPMHVLRQLSTCACMHPRIFGGGQPLLSHLKLRYRPCSLVTPAGRKCTGTEFARYRGDVKGVLGEREVSPCGALWSHSGRL